MAIATGFSLEGSVALVSGASRGLGFAMAQALGEAGATVILNGRDLEILGQRTRELRDQGISAESAAFDVTSERSVVREMDAIATKHGRLDVLINNAGGAHRAPMEKHSVIDFTRMLDLNLTSMMVMAREALKPMSSRGYGRIVNISSIMGLIARPSVPGYVASKHAVAGLTRALAVEFADRGITVNALAPGYFPTEINASLLKDKSFNDYLEKRMPMRRWGRPEELAPVLMMMVSPAASYLTGQIIAVDGGLTAAL